MGRIRLLISDYDRTFTDGTLRVAPGLLDAIRDVKSGGVAFSLVSGRKYSHLSRIVHRLGDAIDSYVAENGCVGYHSGKKHMLCDAIGRDKLLRRLDSVGLGYDAGDVVISVNIKHEKELEDALASVDDKFHVIKNIDSLMVLPAGVSKGTGLSWLCKVYGISREETACIGDAENDLDMRGYCGLLGAVRNALPAMKEKADYVTENEYGEGLAEFIRLIRGQNGK